MARIGIILTVLTALAWSGYVGYDLLVNSQDRFAPGYIFDQTDGAILRINHFDEIQGTELKDEFNRNLFLRELAVIEQLLAQRKNYYLSRERYILVIEGRKPWKRSDIEALKNGLTLHNVNVDADGKYIVLTSDQVVQLKTVPLAIFKTADKKATANYWVQEGEHWKRSDIYALPRGYFEYNTVAATSKASNPVEDAIDFAAVLPQTITKYEFHERFFAENMDTVYANSLMSTWVDKGFVAAEFAGESILVSDYRTSEPPSVALLEHFQGENDALRQQGILAYNAVPITQKFPAANDSSIYLLELEDKVILTTSIETARKINLSYQLGETLALNTHKYNQLFSELPASAHYRYVSDAKKTSRTIRNGIDFTVVTLPPGEQFQVVSSSDNWTSGAVDNVKSATVIQDHLRGSYSVFIYNEKGEYALVDKDGNKIWSGETNAPIRLKPMVVDIYENDKKQLLFHTANKVYLLDLNGNNVGAFPYNSEFEITTDIHTFKWKNTFRYLLGTAKGELIVLNTTGGELNITQAGSAPLQGQVFALNRGGSLRGWCKNNQGEVYLSFLETPAKAESLGASDAVTYQKIMGDVVAFKEVDGHTQMYFYANGQQRAFGKGKLITAVPHFVLRDQNSISVFNRDFSLRMTAALPFNEIGQVEIITLKGQDYLLVEDYLKNKIHLFDSKAQSIQGFPKDGSGFITYAYDAPNNELRIYTGISGSVICYRVKV